MNRNQFGGWLGVVALCGMVTIPLVLAGCGASEISGATGVTGYTSVATQVAATPSPAPIMLVKLKTVTIGRKHMQVLADLSGKTLYYFKPDTSTTVACTASCAQAWPPLTVGAGTPSSSTPLPGHLGTLTTSQGSQVTYNGHPLYTYAKDQDAEDAYGQGVGGEWFVATPDLSVQSSAR